MARRRSGHAHGRNSAGPKVLLGALVAVLVAGGAYLISDGHSSSESVTKTTQTIVPVTVEPSSTTSSTTSTTTTTTLPPTTTTLGSTSSKPMYAVSETTFQLSEPGKTLCAPHGTLKGCVERSMPLYVYYPAAGTPGSVVKGAKPYSSAGKYPLIVFGNGYLEPVSGYSVLLDFWAAEGYLVAAPQFPLSQNDSVGGPWEADILNQPADMSAAISFMASQNSQASSMFHGLVNTGEVAVAGQSDGGDAALAVGYNSCCRDARIRAVISLSGAELSSYPGKYFTSPGPALLVVQGTEDSINVPTDSQTVYKAARSPKYYLTLIGADHMDGYVDVDSFSHTVQTASESFLNYYLKGQAGALQAMYKAGNVTGTATLS